MFSPRFAFGVLLATGLACLAAGPAVAVLRLLDFEATVDERSFFPFGGPAIPEPSSVLLGLASLATVVGIDRRRRIRR